MVDAPVLRCSPLCRPSLGSRHVAMLLGEDDEGPAEMAVVPSFRVLVISLVGLELAVLTVVYCLKVWPAVVRRAVLAYLV